MWADRWRRDDGAATAEFALVAGVTTLVFAAVLQVALVQHVRNTLVDCAGEGARHAALVGNDLGDGVGRTQMLVSSALSGEYAEQVTARTVERGGATLVEVTVRAPLPLLGLVGPSSSLTVRGHAWEEG